MRIKEIFYIKDNNEKNVHINFLNVERISKYLFGSESSSGNGRYYYVVDGDLEYIHFKNIIFYGNVYFKVRNGASLIFDNCDFEGVAVRVKCGDNGGHVQMINPRFKFYGSNVISVEGADDFDFVTDKDDIVTLDVDVDNFSVNTNNHAIGGITMKNDVVMKKISLKNVGDILYTTSLCSDVLSITNSNIDIEQVLNINSSNIQIDDDSAIRAKYVFFNGMKIRNENRNNNCIILNKNSLNGAGFSRLRFLSFLKNWRKELDDAMEVEASLVEDEYKSFFDELDRKYSKEREALEVKKNIAVKKLKKDLLNKKVGYFDCKYYDI